jgi:hypothetical protein
MDARRGQSGLVAISAGEQTRRAPRRYVSLRAGVSAASCSSVARSPRIYPWEHSHLLLARQSAHGANKLSDLASPGNRLGAIAPVLDQFEDRPPFPVIGPAIARAVAGDRLAAGPVGIDG